MRSVIDAFVDRKRVTILLLILVCIMGYMAYRGIPRENTPDVKIPIIYTVVVHEGISPEDAERLLVKPIEKNLRGIEGIKNITSYANEGSASVIIEFNAGFDSKRALNDVRAKVQDAEHDLPQDAKKPSVHEINLSLFPVLSVMLLGDIEESALVKIARDFKNKIEQIDGVMSVNIGGDRTDAVELIIKPEVLEAHKIPLAAVQQLVSSNNALIAAGSIRSKAGEFSIKVPSLIANYHELMNFPVKVSKDSVVRIGDIAEVRKTYKDPVTTAKVNGKPAVVLEVSKRTGENIINVVNDVKKLIQKEQLYLPQNLQILYTSDASEQIITMIADLESNILFAVLLVVIVVVLSVGPRSALLISLSIPSSFLAGMLFLSVFGFTLNVVVLFSLILTVGMIVDDAIVVSEYADRVMLEGVPLNEAFLISAKRMLWPIVTSTLVKIIVFMPLLFWPGVMGQFMKYMPITAIVILTSSLIFALFFQPTLGPLFGKPTHVEEKEGWDAHLVDHVDLAKLKGFTKMYYDLLIKVLDRPKMFVSGIAMSLVGVYTFFIVLGTGVQFFPEVEPDFVHISIIAPGNLSLNEREDMTDKVVQQLLEMHKDIKVVYAKSGNFDTEVDRPDDTIGSILLEYQKWNTRRKSEDVVHDMRSRFNAIKGVKIEITENKPGPPPEKPIQLNIKSRDNESANKAADMLYGYMKNVQGFIQIEDSRSQASMEWHVVADREKAAKYGVDLMSLGNTIRLLTNGLKISSYRPDEVDDEIDILVRYPKDFRTISNLNNLKVINNAGQAIPVSNFVKVEAAPKLKKIKRVDREKVISLKSDVDKGFLTDTLVKNMHQWIHDNKVDQLAQIDFKGESEDQAETSSFLSSAFMLTLILMFVVMLIQFNSIYHTIIIMSAVFLSTVGVLLGLIITWQPFGIVMCGVGVIALGGIVLNNNILFIDTYQHLRKDGIESREAIIRSGVQRLRPILLTAATAVLGLLPMVFGLTIDFFGREITYDAPSSQWWRQLSASIAGGLTFATILTLFFTPCLLLLGKRYDPKYEKKND